MLFFFGWQCICLWIVLKQAKQKPNWLANTTTNNRTSFMNKCIIFSEPLLAANEARTACNTSSSYVKFLYKSKYLFSITFITLNEDRINETLGIIDYVSNPGFRCKPKPESQKWTQNMRPWFLIISYCFILLH